MHAVVSNRKIQRIYILLGVEGSSTQRGFNLAVSWLYMSELLHCCELWSSIDEKPLHCSAPFPSTYQHQYLCSITCVKTHTCITKCPVINEVIAKFCPYEISVSIIYVFGWLIMSNLIESCNFSSSCFVFAEFFDWKELTLQF